MLGYLEPRAIRGSPRPATCQNRRLKLSTTRGAPHRAESHGTRVAPGRAGQASQRAIEADRRAFDYPSIRCDLDGPPFRIGEARYMRPADGRWETTNRGAPGFIGSRGGAPIGRCRNATLRPFQRVVIWCNPQHARRVYYPSLMFAVFPVREAQMKKVLVALVATLVAVSMTGCVGIGKGKGVPPRVVTKG
jgi:hypothetical protein